MVDGYMLNKKKFDDNKIFTVTDDKLPDDITLNKILILMTCVIKDEDKYYPQIFLEETLYVK